MSTTIDAHHHLWQIRRYDYGWITPETPVLGRDYMPVHLAPELRAAGVARTVLVQTFHSEAETRWFLQLADQHPFIAGVVGWSDLTDPDLGARLDALAHPKLVGLRHVVQGEPDVDWLVHPAVIQGLKELERRGLSFDLLLLPQHLKHVPTLARALPALRMVIDHLAKPPIREGQLEPWARDLAAAAEHPNVFCKLSGMVTEADHAQWTVDDLRPYVAHALEVFGPVHVWFGLAGVQPCRFVRAATCGPARTGGSVERGRSGRYLRRDRCRVLPAFAPVANEIKNRR